MWWTVVKVLLFVVAVPPMLNYAGLKQERDHLITNATLFDVGFGQKLFMSCEGAGRPTVILDAPTGLTSEVWRRGQAELVRAGAGRVCVYDRAGLGWSEAPPPLNMSDPGEAAVGRTLGPEATALRMVADLHRLVSIVQQLERPLVLVGAELGGLVARLYTQLHPEDVAHLVMIDPVAETLFEEGGDNPWPDYWRGHVLPSLQLLQVAAMTGLARLGLVTGLISSPHEDSVRVKHHFCDPFHVQAVIDEHRNLNQSLHQMAEVAAAAPSLAEAGPQVTVVSGGQHDHQLAAGLNHAWSRGVQRVIAATGSRHVVISDGDRGTLLAGHVAQVLAPVIKNIRMWRQQQQ